MRFVSAFTGIGGMDLGFEQAGWKCVGQVELDKHARSVLERHWPEVPKHDDITTAIEWADRIGLVGGVDVVAGGFPCQPFSVAGKRLGRDDLRGNLFWNALEFTSHVGAPIPGSAGHAVVPRCDCRARESAAGQALSGMPEPPMQRGNLGFDLRHRPPHLQGLMPTREHLSAGQVERRVFGMVAGQL